MKKKICGLLIIMSVLLLPVIANAATSGSCGSGVRWSYDNGTLIISGSGKMVDYSSRAQRPYHTYEQSIKRVVIEDGVTSIGQEAFDYCRNLTNVTIGKSVTYIGKDAFTSCGGLTNIIIPDSVITIGDDAFSWCSGLTSITIGRNVKTIGESSGNVFYSCKNIQDVYISDIGQWCQMSFGRNLSNPLSGANLYVNNELATDITIPSNVNSIVDAAFAGCKSLTSVNIPDNVRSIGDYAFRSCKLTSVTINSNSIGENAFDSSGLTNVTLGDKVRSIGDYAFYACGLTSVTIPSGVTSIGTNAFAHNRNLKILNFNSEYCNSMGSENYPAFLNCTNLNTINIGENVRRIPSNAFQGCSALTNITIPENVTSIGSNAFYNCSALKTLYYNAKNCTSAGSYNTVFENTALEEVHIGDGVKTIPAYFFYNCDKLTAIEMGKNITNINSNAFSGCTGLTTITIPSNVAKIEADAFANCSALETVCYNADNCTSMGSKESSVFTNCPVLTTINIGENVKTLPDYAFNNCRKITNMTIPSEVTRIGSSVFSGCNALSVLYYNASNCSAAGYSYNTSFENTALKEVYIGDDVKNIPPYLFSKCTGLTDITMPNSITNIGNNAFYECNNLSKVNITDLAAWCGISFSNATANPLNYAKNLYVNDELVTDIIIPDSITDISAYSFYNCSGATSITIPSSVRSIGTDAFYGCNKLIKVNIKDMAGWCNISFGNVAANPLSCAKKLYLNDELLSDLIIPDSITDISAYSFYNCSGATSITIPGSVRSIGRDAFYGCNKLSQVNIKDIAKWCNISFDNATSNPLNCAKKLYLNDELVIDIIIPDSVTDISAYAFYNCSGSTSVTIPISVKSIGIDAFYGCNKLNKVNITDIALWCDISFDNSYSNPLYYAKNLYINDEIISDITIPNSVTTISDYAFCNCNNALNITVSNTVNSIDNNAFYNCSKLENIIFDGTRQNWNTIFQGTLSSKTVVHTIENINDMTIEEILSMVYNGEELIPEPVVKDGGVILVQNQDYNISYENNIAVGTAYVTITGTEEENSQTYAKYTGNKTISFSIEKANPTFVIEPTAKTNLIYDGTEQELLTYGKAEGGIIQYSFEENDNFSDIIPVAADAGIYTVYYKILGDDNYNDSETYNISVSIHKAEAGVTIPMPKEDLIYNGSEQELINPGGSDNGIMQYSFKENADFSTDIPTATNAGTYTIYYKVVGDKNHNDGEVYAITTKIAKTEPYIIAPTVKENIVYNGKPQELVNAGIAEGGTIQYSFKGNSNFSEDIIKATNAGAYVVYYKVMGDNNHSDSGVGSLEITIKKALPDVQKPDKLTAFIGQILSEVELPSNWKWITPEIRLNTAGSHTFEAEYIPTDTNNYNTVLDNISVNVQNTPLSTVTPTTAPTTKPTATPDIPQETDIPQQTERPAETDEPIIVPESMPFEIQNAIQSDGYAGASVVNISDNPQSGLVIFVAYSDKGALLVVKTRKIENLAANASRPCEFELPNGTATSKMLVWRSWKDMLPLADSVEIK